MRRKAVALAASGMVFGAVCLTGMATSMTVAAPGAVHRIAPGSPIEHVVILYQENHTFDDVLGAVCEARATPCDGYTGPVTFADGKTAANVAQPDLIPTVAHDPNFQRMGIHNRWDRILGCRDAPYYCVSHVEPDAIPNLAALADRFAVSDRTFAAGKAASFVAHVALGAGTYDGYVGYNPSPPGIGWGCQAHIDALWGPKGAQTMEPACIPDKLGAGPYRQSKVPYAPTVMERMEQAGLSWHIYEGRKPQAKPDITNFSVCTYFYWCYHNRFTLNYDSSLQGFLLGAQHGTLPNLSILIPDFNLSQHNGTSMAKGDDYIGQVVSAVENGPNWDSTAIFITYDDCGCFYDHVTPPSPAMGLRNPLVIVSPWARPTSTDSTDAIQPYSILAFVQHVFGLKSLTAKVDRSYDYADSFDFSQQPLAGIPMTHTKVPAWELREIARLRPMMLKDPT